MCSPESERYDLLACNTAFPSGNVCAVSHFDARKAKGERRRGAEWAALLRLLPPRKLRYHSIRPLHTTVNKFASPSAKEAWNATHTPTCLPLDGLIYPSE